MNKDYKSVGILAMSYVGATLLSLILGSHPRCRSVGHCYMFFNPYRNKSSFKKLALRENMCRYCDALNKPCSLNKLKDIGGDPIKAYEIIAKELLEKGEDIIIDSSSMRKWFNLSMPDLRITLFRHPVSLASSHVKARTKKMGRARAIGYSCSRFIGMYKGAYGILIEYENIVEETSQLKALFSLIGIDFSPNYLKYWEYNNHIVGGNEGALINVIKHYKPEELDAFVKHVSRGQSEYEKYYKMAEGNFPGNINILTKEEEDLVMARCGSLYNQLKMNELR